LKPLPEAAGPASAPGVAPPPTPEAGTVFTFVHQGGEARLELAYTRADAYPRLSAAAALVLALGAWLALELRARKR
jgi:hypothetical protein